MNSIQWLIKVLFVNYLRQNTYTFQYVNIRLPIAFYIFNLIIIVTQWNYIDLSFLNYRI